MGRSLLRDFMIALTAGLVAYVIVCYAIWLFPMLRSLTV